ncbi:hypothetical protein AB0N19_21010, partial [Streptomyces sp. NPDC051132]|uniref:hypothetical protein n=1 Tax=Streptomyces sp. NPDC051132 TaxID=3155667 RepID=UPI00342866BB
HPDILRFGFTPLYLGFRETERAARASRGRVPSSSRTGRAMSCWGVNYGGLVCANHCVAVPGPGCVFVSKPL